MNLLPTSPASIVSTSWRWQTRQRARSLVRSPAEYSGYFAVALDLLAWRQGNWLTVNSERYQIEQTPHPCLHIYIFKSNHAAYAPCVLGPASRRNIPASGAHRRAGKLTGACSAGAWWYQPALTFIHWILIMQTAGAGWCKRHVAQ